MTNLSASDLTNIVDITLSKATAEAIIKDAIHELNMKLKRAGQELPNLSGTSGSMTVNLDSAEFGAVLKVSKAIYFRDYKGPVQTSIGGVSYSVHRVEDVASECAADLKEVEVSLG